MARREPIAVVALHGGFGGSFNLAKAIEQCSTKYSATLVTSRPAYYGFGDGVGVEKQRERAREVLEGCKLLLICDCGGFLTLVRYLALETGGKFRWEPPAPLPEPLSRWLRDKSLVVFWTGSVYSDRHKEMNALVAGLPCKRRYAMCDLLRHDPLALPLMQTYDGLVPVDKKFDAFTVCHSPGQKRESNRKGTTLVEASLDQLAGRIPVERQILDGIPHRKALVIKAMSHVFVDQVASMAGGIGKSGLEAMCLGVPTLCDMRNELSVAPYNDIPVLDVSDADSLTAAIELLYHDEAERQKLGAECYRWSQRLRFEPTARYLDRTLEWA